MQGNGVALTQFEWIAVMAVTGLLVSVIAWLLVMLIKDLREKIAVEREERGIADNELAATLKEVSEAMQLIRLENTEAHGGFALRGDVEKSQRRVYEKLDDIRESQARVESTMVTKDECLERARCPT